MANSRFRKPTQELKTLDDSKFLSEDTPNLVPSPTGPRGGGPISVGQGAVFHDGDLRPAMVKLIQPTSANGTPGSLYRTDTEEEFPELVVVPLKIQAVRTKWPGVGGFSRDRFPECVSYDGITSITRFSDGRTPRFVGQPCNTCEFYTTAPWSVPTGEEFCQPGYSVLVMDAESFEVYGMRLHGTANRVARMLGLAAFELFTARTV